MKQYKLPKEFLDNWISGLKSNKYKQGSGRLYDEYTDCYCALGVCAIANKYVFKHHGIMATKDDIKLYDFIPERLYSRVYKLNDEHNMPFDKIAYWLENNVEAI